MRDHPLAVENCADCRTASTMSSGRLSRCWVCEALSHTSLAPPAPKPTKDAHRPSKAVLRGCRP